MQQQQQSQYGEQNSDGVPFPKLKPETREATKEEEKILGEHVDKLNGTKDSIKTMSQWFMSKSEIANSLMKYLVKLVETVDFNNFGKKLHICYVINDVLHESMKMRETNMMNLDALDHVSNAILHSLPVILKSSFQGYSPHDQEKMHSLLTLWCDRHIFQQEHINYIGNCMMTPISGFAWPQNQWNNGWYPAPLPPSNLLHLSPGFVVDIVLNLLRNEDFPKYTPIPINLVPPCMPENIPKTPNYILDKYEDFEQALEVMDSKYRRDGRRSRSRSRSRSRDRGYRRKRERRRRFSRSRSSSGSRSRSRSNSDERRRRRRSYS